jgi:hypothetical protein
MQGNILHVEKRFEERLSNLSPEETKRVLAAVKGLNSLAKKRALPNESWFRTVTHNDKPVAHLVGQGVYLSSVYSGTMVPRGRKV